MVDTLERHDHANAEGTPVAGVVGTYPTFLHDDLVVKLFGYYPSWRKSYAAECAAQALIATEPDLAAPRLWHTGGCTTIPMPRGPIWSPQGCPESDGDMPNCSPGRGLRSLQTLDASTSRTRPASGGRRKARILGAPRVVAAAEHSSLPPHLIAQIDDYLPLLETPDRVFVCGHLMFRHVLVDNDRLTGIIDWGDAVVTDRLYEFAKFHIEFVKLRQGVVAGVPRDQRWPVTKDFPRKSMNLGVHLQAIGLAQHHTMDVFYMLLVLLPVQDIGTLDDLATELFKSRVRLLNSDTMVEYNGVQGDPAEEGQGISAYG